MKRFLRYTVALILVLALSCIDETPLYTIPYAPVNFRVDLKGLDHELNGALSYKIFTEKEIRTPLDRIGYGGLLLVRDLEASTLYAYDLCCPHEDNKAIVVIPSSDGKTACPTCSSVFVTMFGLGSAESGPAREPLQRYHVIPRGNNIFEITNLGRR